MDNELVIRNSVFVLQGDFRIERQDIARLIGRLGGKKVPVVWRNVDYLVLGERGQFDNHQAVIDKTEALIAEGYPISIISESELIEMIKKELKAQDG
jgi:NAD-dependent DNA ligase